MGLAITILLGACDKRPPVGEIGAVEGFIGGVAAEEPHAAVVARDVLSAGGTATDAVIAAFFTMTVTYPVAAGIGGGGACVVYDSAANEAQGIEFLPRSPSAGGAIAVPGAVRGLAALHARYGRLGWSALVAPAERMARFGHNVSRAFARRLRAGGRRVLREAELRELFGTDGRGMIGEGDPWTRVELASVLSQIRVKGAGDLHGGAAGRSFVEGASAAGGKVTIADLRAYRANWRETRRLEFGDEIGHFMAAEPAGLGALHDIVVSLRPEAARASPDARVAAIAAGYGTGRGSTRPEDSGEAAVVAGDPEGSIVACVFTMGRAFGAGRVARAAGVILAPTTGWDAARLTPMIVVNHNIAQGYLAPDAAGPAASGAVAQVALDLLEAVSPLDRAMAASRVMRHGARGEIYQEPRQGIQPASGAKPAKALGRVQAIWCPGGLIRSAETCRFASDGRGFGLAIGAAL